jgi:ribosomal protein S26
LEKNTYPTGRPEKHNQENGNGKEKGGFAAAVKCQNCTHTQPKALRNTE